MFSKHKKASYFCSQALFSNISNFIELENRITNLPVIERGDAFEVFAEAYLKTQPLHQVEEIWPEKSLSQSLRDLLDIPSDAGIDGVFKTFSGDYKAYQVKFRSNRDALNWNSDGLGNFFGQTDRVSQRILFTNSIDLSHLASSRVDFYSIKGNELDNLTTQDFQAIEKWLNTGIIMREKLIPKDHQVQAIEAIMDEFHISDRATAIMACGTGKTLVALKVAEKSEAKAILVLLPSLALIRQTLHDWASNHEWSNFNFLCVCSDNTVIKNNDETILHQRDLDFAVTTQPEDVAKFLSNQTLTTKIIFSTYQSCPIVAQALPPDFTFDMAIFDEAHKTASRSATNYAFALRNENISINKRLFLTATPRHYNIDKRDKSGDHQIVFSMDDETTYGRVAYKLSFRAAVKQNLICDYKVIISVITSDMLNRELLKRGEVVVDGDLIKAQRIANILAIQKAVEQHGVHRIFSFHSSVSAAKSFTAKTNEGVSAYLTDFATMHVNGEMSTSKRDAILNEFRDAEKALISNARCLTEGVNVPAVDMVAFISPKKSKVDIVQATGRAMRKHENKTRGYILIPLFVQIAEDEDLEQAVQKTQFDAIWDVLQAMQELDENLVEIIAQLREDRGRAIGINDNRLRDFIEVLGPELLLNDLRNAITTNMIDNLGSNWDEKFGELIRFKEEHEHCNVPQQSSEYKKLGFWVGVQRKTYNKGKMSDVRIKKLESIGFEWDPLAAKWDIMFDALCEYSEKESNCNVPQSYPKNPDLGTWVSVQRWAYKIKRISLERIKKLESIGFEWNKNYGQWQDMFALLCNYHKKNGDCLVPRDYPEDSALATWVSDQRKMYNKGKLSQGRITKLNSIGFIWDSLDKIWDAKFDELCAYKVKYCNTVPSKYSDYHNLSVWLQHQRIYYREGRLPAERITKLDSIGVDWDPLNNIWHARFKELITYKQVHGNFDVPSKYQESPLLLAWLRNQRTYYKKNKLSQERIALLESISFIWDPIQQQWEGMLRELCKYREEYNHSNVPKRYQKNPQLGAWCQQQRNYYKNGKISEARIKKLEQIGFIWDPMTKEWEQMFMELCKYREIYGDCNVPTRYKTNDRTLGLWVLVQRRTYKEKIMSLQRIMKLESVGFDWDPIATAWESKFYELCKYREVYGHCNIASKQKEYVVLWRWTHNQRTAYKKGDLTPDRIKRLSDIGFVWKMKP